MTPLKAKIIQGVRDAELQFQDQMKAHHEETNRRNLQRGKAAITRQDLAKREAKHLKSFNEVITNFNLASRK
jgi:hypothetical protein